MQEYDIVVIGGGAAGLGTAVSAKENGAQSILILEREPWLGGILNQCIHNGFGLHTFKEELTGPEYAQRLIDKVILLDIEYKLNTMVLDISNEKVIRVVNEYDGVFKIKAKVIILAMGCRERPRGSINIPGSSTAGIYTAGTAQKFVNIDGYIPGSEVVILGSGNMGLIMARRMTLEGAKVKAVFERMNYAKGTKRNIEQCLDNFNIPLRLGYNIIDIEGKDRVEGVTIVKLDEKKKPIKATQEFISCDTLILCVGFLPESELARNSNVKLSKVTGGPEVNESFQTNIEGIFACGNVLQVNDFVDDVMLESKISGEKAALYVKGNRFSGKSTEVLPQDGVMYTVPKYINCENMISDVKVRFRVGNVYENCFISVYFDEIRQLHIKKGLITPAEVESIVLTKAMAQKYSSCKNIIIKIEKIDA